MTRIARALILCGGMFALWPAVAHADPPKTPAISAKNHAPKPTPGPHTGGHLPIGLRILAAWLDDPSVLQPGASAVALSVNYWRSPANTETDVPVADVSVGAGPRLQLQGTFPYAFQSAGGRTNQALGDMYLGAKVEVAGRPDGNRGVAIVPMVEVLSSLNTPAGDSRVHWVLPVSAQIGTDNMRVYGSAGYFSRGAVFGGGALEGDVTDAVTLALSLTYTHSTQATSLVEAAGLRRNQVDVSGGAYVTISRRLALFASVGRTVSQLDADSTRFLVNSGISITFGGAPAESKRPSG